jgi:hypothetical protein
MRQPPTRQEVEALIDRARASFPHDACLTCECFLGYVTQLGLDADEEVTPLLAEMGIESNRTHNCLGCEPCPPADLFADYLRDRHQ